MPRSPLEEKLVKILDLDVEPLHLDKFVRISGVTTPEVSARLTIMEMKELVRNVGGVYKNITAFKMLMCHYKCHESDCC
jgi:predicted Rossmann fold nucleotide-binding protein DprA/Smf involved in DNA uptake